MAHVLDLKGLRRLVMAMVIFDTLKFSKRLKEAGVPSAQAEAEAEVLSEIFAVNLQELPTKEDLQAVKEELRHEIKEVRSEINELRDEVKADINELRNEVKAEIKDVRHEIQDVRHEIQDVRKDMVSMEQRFDIKLEKLEMSLLVKMGIMLASVAGIVVSATVTLIKIL
ncbi:CCDC90 family protein [Mycoavidus sp. SF9855]|uniref:CCDC90 family protein n=1 Tax=Mycoavidus sp. SF9855 TaxID=2968475 RepID=UPI00211C3C07|nr:CCDC90 family protein [Mycoavidus sp. SF9855]UUM21224.1 CCDC90 family protein [Mycoavidus sp. SF9855]